MDKSDGFSLFARKQMILGVLTAVSLQALPASIYISAQCMDIVHPLKWFHDLSFTVMSIRVWSSFIPLLLPMAVIAYTFLKTSTNRSKLATSRFQSLISVFSSLSVIKLFGYWLLSVLLPATYINLYGQSICEKCSWNSELNCLNTTNVYVVACGIWTGFYYLFRYELFPKQVRFPIITLLNFSQIRFKILPAFIQSCRRTVMPVLYFIVVFYVGSTFIYGAMSKIYTCRVDLNDYSPWTFLSPYILLQAWLMSSMVHFSMWALVKCVKVYLTDLHHFQPSELLPALASEDTFRQLHAFRELHLLSLGRIGNATEVFSLGPGGTPQTWNTILQESLRAIKEFQEEMEITSGIRILTPPKTNEPSTPPAISDIHLRRLANRDALIGKKESDSTDTVNQRVQQLIKSAMDFAPIRYIFTPVQEDHLALALENSQHVAWAVESLALLAGRAIKEDRFGVVVNDIPCIVVTMLCLRNYLEKTKIGGPGKQRHRDRPAQMKVSLLSAINRGLCRIAVAYAEYLDHLYLPPDALRALKIYVS